MYVKGVMVWGGLDDFVKVIELVVEIDFIFLGIGVELWYVLKVFCEVFEVVGIGVEVMKILLVCCIYNVLVLEGCCVVVVFLLVGDG